MKLKTKKKHWCVLCELIRLPILLFTGVHLLIVKCIIRFFSTTRRYALTRNKPSSGFRPSVRLSVTLVNCIQTAKGIVTLLSFVKVVPSL